MRLPEMLVNVIDRFIPMNKVDVATLKGELTDKYMNLLNELMEKTEKNAPLEGQEKEILFDMDKLDPHTPEYEKQLFNLEQVRRKMHKLTMPEKIVQWLEKPVVRFMLIAFFLVLSRWIFKKMTESPKPEEEEENQTPPPFQPQYQPYGYGYPPPPPNYYPQNGYGQQGGYRK